MNAVALLKELQVCGIRLAADGERLRYEGPAAAVTLEILQKLTAAKPELLAFLVGEQRAGPWQLVFSPAGAQPCGAEPAAWDAETDRLIAWFVSHQSELPQAPFHLARGIEVTDRERFCAAIRQDIAAGPRGPRARWGAVQTELRRLAALRADVRSGNQADSVIEQEKLARRRGV
jgi:tubulysin polyketide synthase-like protein